MVSTSPQVSFYLVSRGYHIQNCKHLPPVSSFLESVECADLLNQKTIFPEPTHIPAQQKRLGFCHGHYINFKLVTAMPTFHLFHFCGRAKAVNSISKGWGCERSAGFSASITRRSLAGWYKLPKYSQQAQHRLKPAPPSKSMNSARSWLKKFPMLALASGRLHLWQGSQLCLWKKDDQNR